MVVISGLGLSQVAGSFIYYETISSYLLVRANQLKCRQPKDRVKADFLFLKFTAVSGLTNNKQVTRIRLNPDAWGELSAGTNPRCPL